MPGQNPTFQTGPRTYEVSASVTGGQVVEADPAFVSTTQLPACKPAGANSALVLGVAFRDAVPIATRAGYEDGTVAYPGGFAVTDISVPDETVSVYNDAWCQTTYTAAATFRQPIKAAANGQTTPFTPGTDDPSLKIGWCAQIGGVAAGAKGLSRILV